MKILGKKAGFSLIELMIVISIIGVLAALGMPKFKSFQATARQAEVKTNLNHVYVLQESYYTDANAYSTFAAIGNNVTTGPTGVATQCNSSNSIGFALTDCTKIRYQYTGVTASSSAFVVSGDSLASANNKVFPGCSTNDIWTINASKVLTNTQAGATNCL